LEEEAARRTRGVRLGEAAGRKKALAEGAKRQASSARRRRARRAGDGGRRGGGRAAPDDMPVRVVCV